MLALVNSRRAMRVSRRRGFSLIELAMVLAIIALLVAGVMLLFSSASSAQKTNDMLVEVASIQQAARSLYAGQSSYTGITQTQIAQSGQLPNKWLTGGTGSSATGVSDPFNGAVTIGAGSGTGTAGATFVVTFAAVPNQACIKAVTMDFGNGLIDHKADGTDFANVAATPAQANTTCNGSANSNNHTLVWEFN